MFFEFWAFSAAGDCLEISVKFRSAFSSLRQFPRSLKQTHFHQRAPIKSSAFKIRSFHPLYPHFLHLYNFCPFSTHIFPSPSPFSVSSLLSFFPRHFLPLSFQSSLFQSSNFFCLLHPTFSFFLLSTSSSPPPVLYSLAYFSNPHCVSDSVKSLQAAATGLLYHSAPSGLF